MSRTYRPEHGDRESRIQPGLWLTRRRIQVLEAVARGQIAKQIAHDLGVSIPTVHEHLHEMRRLLGAHTSGELVAKAVAHGFLDAGTHGQVPPDRTPDGAREP